MYRITFRSRCRATFNESLDRHLDVHAKTIEGAINELLGQLEKESEELTRVVAIIRPRSSATQKS